MPFPSHLKLPEWMDTEEEWNCIVRRTKSPFKYDVLCNDIIHAQVILTLKQYWEIIVAISNDIADRHGKSVVHNKKYISSLIFDDQPMYRQIIRERRRKEENTGISNDVRKRIEGEEIHEEDKFPEQNKNDNGIQKHEENSDKKSDLHEENQENCEKKSHEDGDNTTSGEKSNTSSSSSEEEYESTMSKSSNTSISEGDSGYSTTNDDGNSNGEECGAIKSADDLTSNLKKEKLELLL
jgi:hypothetical protein